MGALEKTLIPAAQNEELKSLLQTGLKLFTEHERRAPSLGFTRSKSTSWRLDPPEVLHVNDSVE